MADPLVSICIPTYNGSEYIGEAVASALQQTADPRTLELVVSDSGSTDDTLDQVRRATADSPFPVRILPERTPGMVHNWNASVRAARGRYVKFLFQDDRLAPACVEKMLNAATAGTDVALVFSRRTLLIDSAAESLPTTPLLRMCENLHHGFYRLRPMQSGDDLLGDRHLLRAPINKVGEPTVVLIHRQKLLDVGLFNERMTQLVDVEMWLRLMAAGEVAFIDEALASFRVHAGQMTVRNFVTDADRIDMDAILQRLSQPDLYGRLHVVARHVVRRATKSAQHVGPIDHAYAMARMGLHAWRRLRHLTSS